MNGPSSAVQRQSEYQGTTEKITSPWRIKALLQRVQKNHCLLNVFLPDQSKPYTSMILAVDAETSILELDELSPVDGNRAMNAGMTVQIKTQLQGVDMKFSCDVIEIGEEDGLAVYRMTLPEIMLYHQQRQSYRVRISAGHDVSIQLLRGNGETLEGRLRDISVGGIGILFTINAASGIKQGEEVPTCTLTLPDGNQISCPLEIRYVSARSGTKFSTIGARFQDLDQEDEHKIMQLVMELDREARKRS